MNIYNYTSYKKFLSEYIKINSHRGLISEIAKAAGCDRTYISQVLGGKADLLPDHVIRLSHFLLLDEPAADYLLHLLLKDRSASTEAKKKFELKLEKLRNTGLELSQQVKSKKDSNEISTEANKTNYYSNYFFQAIHLLTSIDEFQNIGAIAGRLNISESQVFQILRELEAMGLVVKERDKYYHSGKSFYLTGESPQIIPLHLNFRIEAVRRSQIRKDIHFSNIFSVSKHDIDLLKTQILELIELHRKTVHKSGSETVAIFCCDFFEL